MFEEALLKFTENPTDVFTVDDAMKGVSIVGGTGSGKTSGSGKALAKKYLRKQWGGIVLCAKKDEVKLWRKYCAETGREKDLIVFSNNAVHQDGDYAGQRMIFNPLDYEMNRDGDGAGEVLNLTHIFMSVYKLGNRINGDSDVKEERYWDSALKRCLNRVFELLKLADEPVTYQHMIKVLNTSRGINEELYNVELTYAQENEDFSRIDSEEFFCLKCLIKANPDYQELAAISQEHQDMYDLVYNYFLIELPSLDEKTTSIVFESFMGIAEPFLSGVLYRHFSGETNLKPELTFTDKKVIVLDFPVREYLESGIIAQILFKMFFQQAVERRNTDEYPNPVFLWSDEVQYFVQPTDQLFLTTARSSRTATVFLTQSMSNYYAAMGNSDDARAKVDSLMGNLATKIFHANSDAVTNEYASRLFGNYIGQLKQSGQNRKFLQLDFGSSDTSSETQLPQVLPKEFTMLKSGGINHDFMVEAYIFITGKTWANGTNYIKSEMEQDLKKELELKSKNYAIN